MYTFHTVTFPGPTGVIQDIHCSAVLEMEVSLGIAKSPDQHSESGFLEAL